jgi:hypothetical protein
LFYKLVEDSVIAHFGEENRAALTKDTHARVFAHGLLFFLHLASNSSLRDRLAGESAAGIKGTLVDVLQRVEADEQFVKAIEEMDDDNLHNWSTFQGLVSALREVYGKLNQFSNIATHVVRGFHMQTGSTRMLARSGTETLEIMCERAIMHHFGACPFKRRDRARDSARRRSRTVESGAVDRSDGEKGSSDEVEMAIECLMHDTMPT